LNKTQRDPHPPSRVGITSEKSRAISDTTVCRRRVIGNSTTASPVHFRVRPYPPDARPGSRITVRVVSTRYYGSRRDDVSKSPISLRPFDLSSGAERSLPGLLFSLSGRHPVRVSRSELWPERRIRHEASRPRVFDVQRGHVRPAVGKEENASRDRRRGCFHRFLLNINNN